VLIVKFVVPRKSGRLTDVAGSLMEYVIELITLVSRLELGYSLVISTFKVLELLFIAVLLQLFITEVYRANTLVT
jgi:hypothetical protein